MSSYFDQFPCGVNYEAIGNGGWSACYRVQGGMAACNPSGNPKSQTLVKWNNGTAITNVAHINSVDDNNVVVVTDDGKAYFGNMNNVPSTPIVDSGAIASTGGKNPMCVLVKNGNKKDVLCGKTNLTRPALPADFDVMQLSAGYGLVCALNRQGEAWCWSDGGNFGGGLGTVVQNTPSKLPFSEPVIFIAAGQNGVCGIKQSGGAECKFSYYDNRFLPSANMDQLGVTPANFAPNVKAIQMAYGKGVFINKDGSAQYYPGPTTLNVGKAVAAGGDRAAISVVNENGDVYVVDGGTASLVSGQYKAEPARCSL